MVEINRALVEKILETVDAGLVAGVGDPEPGKMCVEAAVCYSLGLPHGDDPGCVAQSVRKLKIRLNDSRWSSPAARAAGLRRLAIAQLGTAENFDSVEFSRRVAVMTVQTVLPPMLRRYGLETHATACEAATTIDDAADAASAASAAAAHASASVYYAAVAASAAAHASASVYYAAVAAADAAVAAADAAVAAADAAVAAADAAVAAADAAVAAADADDADAALSAFADRVVQILIDMDTPGSRWLSCVG